MSSDDFLPRKDVLLKKRVIYHVEGETGDIIDIKYIKDPKPIKDYIMVFYSNLADTRVNGKRINITTPQLLLISKMNINNILTPDSKTIEKLSKEHQIPVGTFNSAKDALIKDNIIIRTESGKYMVNPYLFNKTKLSALDTTREIWDRLTLVKFKEDVKKELAKKDREINEIKGELLVKEVKDLLNNE